MRLAGIAVLLAACGGGGAVPTIDASGVPDAIPPIVCRGASDTDLVQVTPVTAVPFSASVGERLAAPLTVRVHTAEDVGIVGCTIAWGAGANNGWIFPLSPVTGDDGVASAWWIPGTDPDEIATAMIWVPDAWATADLTATIAPTATRASAITASFASDPYEGFAIDVQPRTAPADTRFAIGWAGGSAALVDASGARGVRFEVDGASPIDAAYPWTTGTSYQLALASVPAGDGVDLTLTVRVAGDPTATTIGTLHVTGTFAPTALTATIEDLSEPATSCLAAAARSAAFSSAMITAGGATAPLTSAALSATPDAIACGNVDATIDSGAFVLTTGGSDVGDPAVTHLAL